LKHPQIDPVTQLQTQSPAERLADRQQRHTGQSFFNKFLGWCQLATPSTVLQRSLG
jgi:hypothetical protein